MPAFKLQLPLESEEKKRERLIAYDIESSKLSLLTTNGELIRIPRTVLAIESEKLKLSFDAAAKSSECLQSDLVVNINASSPLVKQALQVIYSPDPWLITIDDEEGLFHFAGDYGLERLKAIAEGKMAQKVTLENAFEKIDRSREIGAKQLEAYAMKFLRHKVAIFDATTWVEFIEKLRKNKKLG